MSAVAPSPAIICRKHRFAALNDQFMRDVDIHQIQRKLIEQDAILSAIDGREPWLGESVTVWQSSAASLAAV